MSQKNASVIERYPTLRACPPYTGTSLEVLLSTPAYDSDLGLTTPAAVMRQTALDLPRSVVRHRGRRVVTYDHLRRLTPHLRFCTQCSMAPVVEWMHRSGAVVLEGGTPLTVEICPCHSLMIQKHFRVANSRHVVTHCVDVSMHVSPLGTLVCVTPYGHRGGVDDHDWVMLPSPTEPTVAELHHDTRQQECVH